MGRGKYQAKKGMPLWLYWALIGVLTALFLFSAWQVAAYYIDGRTQENRYDALSEIVEAARNEATQPRNPQPGGTKNEADTPELSVLPEDAPEMPVDLYNEDGILREYALLYEMNRDLVGWIQIEGTQIDYPVMQTPGDAEYYLERNFDKAYNSRGCIFVGGECDVAAPSDNLTIYGHAMKDNTMFGELDQYLKESYWQEHRFIRFDTLTGHHLYEIFAVFTTTATVGQGFSYHEFIDAESEAEFANFVERCRQLAVYDTGIVPQYGDKIICLSTCEYTQVNGRLVVAAVRIR